MASRVAVIGGDGIDMGAPPEGIRIVEAPARLSGVILVWGRLGARCFPSMFANAPPVHAERGARAYG